MVFAERMKMVGINKHSTVKLYLYYNIYIILIILKLNMKFHLLLLQEMY